MADLPYYDTIQVAVVREPADPQVVVIAEGQAPEDLSEFVTQGEMAAAIAAAIASAIGMGGGTQGPTVYEVTNVSSFSRQHAYPYLPDVRLIEPEGDEVETGIEYPDGTHVYIEFPTPFSGTIILS